MRHVTQKATMRKTMLHFFVLCMLLKFNRLDFLEKVVEAITNLVCVNFEIEAVFVLQ